MRAWQIPELGNPWEKLTIVQTDLPALQKGSVKISVEATDLNFADILQCQGSYQVKLAPPFTPGMTAAGTVIEASIDSPFKAGDRVVGPTLDIFGGYAEQAIVLSEQCQLLPEHVSTHTAAAMDITYTTAWFAFHQRGQLKAGETVLVLAGAGGVGSAAIQLAKCHGCWVIAGAGSAEKAATCKALGADEVIDYRNQSLFQQVRELTDGRGVDVVYDPVGGEHFNTARRLLAWEGRLLVIGFASGDIPSAPANHALVKNYSVVGVHMGGYRGRNSKPFEVCYRELYQMLLEEKISPLIDQTIGFTDLPQALLRLANRGTQGRVVFDPKK